jgi:hypothetical protein
MQPPLPLSLKVPALRLPLFLGRIRRLVTDVIKQPCGSADNPP